MCPSQRLGIITPKVIISDHLNMYPKGKIAAENSRSALEKKASNKYKLHIGPEIKWNDSKKTFLDTGYIEVRATKRLSRNIFKTARLILEKNKGNISKSWSDFFAIGVPQCFATKEHTESGIKIAADKAVALAAKHNTPLRTHLRDSILEAGQVLRKEI